MKKLESQKGAITIITLVSILFMVSFLISSYILVANKSREQQEMVEETRKIYESKSTMEEIYNSYLSNEEIIPIYTIEQLLKIGSDETIQIEQANGKLYQFTNQATYVLMNDLDYTGELLISESFTGNLEDNGHAITLINGSGETCICNNSNNFNGILVNIYTDESNIGGNLSNIPDEYKDKVYNIVDGVPIPKGFKYVKGTINTGVVITDDYSGLEDKGNEFVWVPVDGVNLTFSKTAFKGESLSNKEQLSRYWLSENTTEYKNLVSSVQKYKGFYMGRFEASNNSQYVAQVKRGYDPWTDIKDSVYEKASTMYSGVGNYENYISTHLVYPQEWDTTMNWIIQTGTKTREEVVDDSSSWGIYNQDMQKTGSSENTIANNIYDLAGNAAEFSQEFYGTIGYFSVRGGTSNYSAKQYPAASRAYYTYAYDYLGFRICMMLDL